MENNKNQNILTKEGLKELRNELNDLIQVQRPRVIEEIKEARSQGDLSENAEFDAAREKQGQIEDRISEIEAIIQNSQVLSTTTSKRNVRIGSTVTIENISTKSQETYTIVGTLEADPFSGKVSNQSPIAMAILGLKEGEIATVKAPSKYQVKVVKIS